MFKYVAALSLALGLVTGAAADEKPYKEGPVTNVSFVRVKDGKLLDYIAYLGVTYKQQMDALKKSGLVTEYRIYQVAARRPDDPNLILTVTYPNYAALDHNADFDAVTAKVQGSLKQADAAFGARSSMREVLGTELVQELILK